MKQYLSIFIISLLPLVCLCDPTSLDTSFNQNSVNQAPAGTVAINPGLTTSVINPCVGFANKVQSDGKTVIAGYSTFSDIQQIFVARYQTNGLLDNTFGTNGQGWVTTQINGSTESQAFGVDIDQETGSIIVAGYAIINDIQTALVINYTSQGILDSSFSNDGLFSFVIENGCIARALVIDQTNGDIIITGDYNNHQGIFAASLSYDGILNESFGSDGAGYSFIFDGQFSTGYAITLQENGKIIITGFSPDPNNSLLSQFTTLRLTSDGFLDNHTNNPTDPFGPSREGFTITPTVGESSAYAVSIQTDFYDIDNDKIIAAGYSQDGNPDSIMIVRYTHDGILDTSFNATGIVLTEINVNNASYAEATGVINLYDKITIGGNIYFQSGRIDTVVARYNNDGSLDESFTSDGYTILDVEQGSVCNCIALQTFDQKIVMAGQIQLEGQGYKQGSLLRILGGFIPENLPLTTDLYGTNSAFISQFLYQSFYAQYISNVAVRNATLAQVNSVISTYASAYASQPDFNFITYLYLIQEDLNQSELILIDQYPDYQEEIHVYFNALTNRLFVLSDN